MRNFSQVFEAMKVNEMLKGGLYIPCEEYELEILRNEFPKVMKVEEIVEKFARSCNLEKEDVYSKVQSGLMLLEKQKKAVRVISKGYWIGC